jgi:hypothetical protein
MEQIVAVVKSELVYWDRNGFAMWRFERGRFRPVFSPDGKLAADATEAAELALIIGGLDLSGARRRPRWQPTPELLQ